jgi:hypothetical protein
MMKVAVGILEGICPPEGIALLLEYLHIHRLSHYAIHTDESLGWLVSAISTFWKILKAPNGSFITNELIDADWQIAQKLHYMWHYAEAVREKGALPSYSTDRTEIWHKPLNSAFRRSNKGSDVYRFILTEQTRLAAFHSMVDDMEFEEDDDDEESAEAEATTSSSSKGIAQTLHSSLTTQSHKFKGIGSTESESTESPEAELDRSPSPLTLPPRQRF